MALSPELLDEGMQTYEEFRLQVERDLYGESLEQVTAGDIPTKPIEEVVFEHPKPVETRNGFPRFTSFTSVVNRG